jgi:WD40 repeat protein
LTWSEEGTARLWNITTGKQIGQEMRHEGNVNGTLFNRNETSILTWSDDGTIRFWDVETGKPIGIEMQHNDIVNGAAFNRDETAILTWSRDGTARLWDIGVDWDFPKEHIKLQIMVLTGTGFDATTMEIKAIEPERWLELKERYLKIAAEHYKTCRYRDANVYRKLFLKEKIEAVKRGK